MKASGGLFVLLLVGLSLCLLVASQKTAECSAAESETDTCSRAADDGLEVDTSTCPDIDQAPILAAFTSMCDCLDNMDACTDSADDQHRVGIWVNGTDATLRARGGESCTCATLSGCDPTEYIDEKCNPTSNECKEANIVANGCLSQSYAQFLSFNCNNEPVAYIEGALELLCNCTNDLNDACSATEKDRSVALEKTAPASAQMVALGGVDCTCENFTLCNIVPYVDAACADAVSDECQSGLDLANECIDAAVANGAEATICDCFRDADPVCTNEESAKTYSDVNAAHSLSCAPKAASPTPTPTTDPTNANTSGSSLVTPASVLLLALFVMLC